MLTPAYCRPQNKSAVTTFNYEEYRTKPVAEFLNHCKLSKHMQDIILYAVALLIGPKDDVPTETAMDLVVDYLNAIGRFGTTAFIWNMYVAAAPPSPATPTAVVAHWWHECLCCAHRRLCGIAGLVSASCSKASVDGVP